MSADAPPPRPVAMWRFWLPLSLQVVLILGIPVQALYTYLSGRTVVLQTLPVDPYDLLQGDSQTLRYDISSVETLERLPGWESLVRQTTGEQANTPRPGTRFYVILEAPETKTHQLQRPAAWEAIAVRRDYPLNLPDDQVALEGRFGNYWADYGLETYYLPADQREEINAYINRTLQLNPQERPFVVEVKIDSRGDAVPVTLWIGDRQYRF